MNPKLISVWSGPRNISTALMYAFAQRNDTVVYDEPLYAHYLANSNAVDYHPGAKEVLETMEQDAKKLIHMMLGEHDVPIVFFKQMTHHLYKFDWSFLSKMTNVILTRNPIDMLPSYGKEVETPSMLDVGYAMHLELVEYLENLGQEIIVLDSKNILTNPQKQLSSLCNKLDIPFSETMLSWEKGPIKEDGCWAPYWYHNVHKSTGFNAYKPKTNPFPEKLKPLLEECIPIYNRLLKYAI
jgi:hypothetical protein